LTGYHNQSGGGEGIKRFLGEVAPLRDPGGQRKKNHLLLIVKSSLALPGFFDRPVELALKVGEVRDDAHADISCLPQPSMTMPSSKSTSSETRGLFSLLNIGVDDSQELDGKVLVALFNASGY
jgi:hypothetical protein